MKKRTAIISIVVFAAVLGISAYAYNALSAKARPETNLSVAAGQGEVAGSRENAESEKTKAPDFTMLDAAGNEVKLSDLFGKPIVLNFWASWCPPCKTEMPEFDKVYKESGGDVRFMMVDLADGWQETTEKGLQYAEDQGFSFPVYFDTRQEGAYIYGIQAIPTTIFIDGDGYIVTAAQGAIDEKTLLKGLDLIK
ncbi:MAG: redoxin domain-containing protein [Gracilibacteraceae bacterium]|jgi:thiol-disulfide isomerase/thioredoxin|nr:redoxin domain-containing protein [Gracilibacteraceae bacterium]